MKYIYMGKFENTSVPKGSFFFFVCFFNQEEQQDSSFRKDVS